MKQIEISEKDFDKMLTALYSERIRKMMVQKLTLSANQGRINIYEWRNFMEIDLIPIIRHFLSHEVFKVKKK